MKDSRDVEITLSDLSGRKIADWKINATSFELPLKNLNEGVYLLSLKSQDSFVVRKIIYSAH